MSGLLNRHFPALATCCGEWRSRWANSTGRRWLQAWLAELAGLLPPALAARLGQADAPQPVAWPLSGQHQAGRPAILVLAAHHVMTQRLILPLAATANLREVLRYEMDRYTPYPADQVHFVARLKRRQPPHAEVELVAVSRAALDLMLDTCAAQGLQLAGIDALDAFGQRLSVDLLPADDASRRSRPVLLDRWLWLGAVACGVALAAACLDRGQRELAAMQQASALQRIEVRHVQQLRQTLDDTLGASTYLANLKAQRPTLTHLLADLSSCLGDDTWVEHLEVRDGTQVTFSGQSARASALIAEVKACPTLEQAQFQGIIQADKTTGRDRFSISAQLKQEAVHAPTH